MTIKNCVKVAQLEAPTASQTRTAAMTSTSENKLKRCARWLCRGTRGYKTCKCSLKWSNKRLMRSQWRRTCREALASRLTITVRSSFACNLLKQKIKLANFNLTSSATRTFRMNRARRCSKWQEKMPPCQLKLDICRLSCKLWNRRIYRCKLRQEIVIDEIFSSTSTCSSLRTRFASWGQSLRRRSRRLLVSPAKIVTLPGTMKMPKSCEASRKRRST